MFSLKKTISWASKLAQKRVTVPNASYVIIEYTFAAIVNGCWADYLVSQWYPVYFQHPECWIGVMCHFARWVFAKSALKFGFFETHFADKSSWFSVQQREIKRKRNGVAHKQSGEEWDQTRGSHLHVQSSLCILSSWLQMKPSLLFLFFLQ